MRIVRCWLVPVLLWSALLAAQSPSRPVYLDPSQPLAKRVDDLVRRMTLDEKISQMMNNAPAIERLQVPAYDWWSEGLHGVARAGVATVFPQAIGLAATWDTPLMHDVAGVISTEARAKYNDALRRGVHAQYYGLTFWSPNINIFRDPRWGRGQETYGEDPFLTSRMGVAFVEGMQGDDPRYLKVVATPKHFGVHSGPEPLRHGFNVNVSPRDLEETYFPAFRATVMAAHADSVMCAYNAVDGQPACANNLLLRQSLRGAWDFNGYVVSDCDAVDDIERGHHFASSPEQAAADAVKAGTDLDCGSTYKHLKAAVQQGLISETDIDLAVRRLFTARFRLGMFDPAAMVPYDAIPLSENDSPAHRALNQKAARESMVLLKNDGVLPLSSKVKRIAVIGPNADSVDVLVGNYHGTPSKPVTVVDGMRTRFGAGNIFYAPGSPLAPGSASADVASLTDEAIAAARKADAVVMVLGISPRLEGEEMKVDIPGFEGGDRTSLDLPAPQEELLEKIAALKKPLVVVLLNGSALSVNWAQQHADAILEAWYPGGEGGTAVAETLAGDNNPAGRLPVTFYESVNDLPPFTDYSMQGRTYRYFQGQPLYRFGDGLSYSNFAYHNASVTPATDGVTVSVEVENTSARDGDEVVETYLSTLNAQQKNVVPPNPVLAGFRRVHLAAHAKQTVEINIPAAVLTGVDAHGQRVPLVGLLHIDVGGHQPGPGSVGADFKRQ